MLTQRDLEWFFGNGIGSTEKVKRYPLTDIGTDENDNLIINVAIAGFDKDDIDIEIQGNELHISGTVEEPTTDVKYVQKHISNNDFERILVLHENYIGGDIEAKVEKGILTIKIQSKEPARKLIEIQ